MEMKKISTDLLLTAGSRVSERGIFLGVVLGIAAAAGET